MVFWLFMREFEAKGRLLLRSCVYAAVAISSTDVDKLVPSARSVIVSGTSKAVLRCAGLSLSQTKLGKLLRKFPEALSTQVPASSIHNNTNPPGSSSGDNTYLDDVESSPAADVRFVVDTLCTAPQAIYSVIMDAIQGRLIAHRLPSSAPHSYLVRVLCRAVY
jgi:hypothetical protein